MNPAAFWSRHLLVGKARFSKRRSSCRCKLLTFQHVNLSKPNGFAPAACASAHFSSAAGLACSAHQPLQARGGGSLMKQCLVGVFAVCVELTAYRHRWSSRWKHQCHSGRGDGFRNRKHQCRRDHGGGFRFHLRLISSGGDRQSDEQSGFEWGVSICPRSHRPAAGRDLDRRPAQPAAA